MVQCPPLSVTRLLRGQLAVQAAPDSYRRCSGKTFLAMTPLGASSPELVSDFSSNEDLVSAALASSHLPLLNDGSPVYYFRGRPYNDGALTTWLPCPPAKACIRVSPLPAGTMVVGLPGIGAVTVPDTDIDPSKFGGGSRCVGRCYAASWLPLAGRGRASRRLARLNTAAAHECSMRHDRLHAACPLRTAGDY